MDFATSTTAACDHALGSRAHVSDDNPYSEAQFKTLKYRPDFPDRFDDHRHGGIGWMAPAAVHDGTAVALTPAGVFASPDEFCKPRGICGASAPDRGPGQERF